MRTRVWMRGLEVWVGNTVRDTPLQQRSQFLLKSAHNACRAEQSSVLTPPQGACVKRVVGYSCSGGTCYCAQC